MISTATVGPWRRLFHRSILWRLVALWWIAAAFSGCAHPARVASPTEHESVQAAAFARRFDRVDKLVRTRYYARDLHGIQWQELSARYSLLVAQVGNDAEWYDTVNEMLCELRDAHTRVCEPERSRQKVVRERGDAAPGREQPFVGVLPDGVVYLRFGRFDHATIRWLTRTISSHQSAPGMIVDLRDNAGGLVSSARRAVGLFFAKPVPMGQVIGRDAHRTIEHSKSTGTTHYSGPLAVLVGRGSHSSAEVFAYVMQHHARAVVVGQTTAGQVLGARPFRLPDGGRLFVSVSDFQRLEGGRLEGSGVRPDVMIASTAGRGEIPAAQSADDVIAAALEVLRGTGRNWHHGRAMPSEKCVTRSRDA